MWRRAPDRQCAPAELVRHCDVAPLLKRGPAPHRFMSKYVPATGSDSHGGLNDSSEV
jgi:hypothetical protein